MMSSRISDTGQMSPSPRIVKRSLTGPKKKDEKRKKMQKRRMCGQGKIKKISLGNEVKCFYR